MELQFEKTELPCLSWKLRDVQSQEQTMELRLPEGMPDIGNILGAWGQSVLRGKEWHSGEVNVSGGVMIWVLYQPADGSALRSVEAWLPMQQKWGLTDCRREGIIRSRWLLSSVDARTLSARKLMLRATAQLLAEILEPTEAQLYAPTSLPEDIQLLQREYPVLIPREAGEKTFRLEETLLLPTGVATPEKILSCQVMPILTEQKVVGGKAVFRGCARCHVLYLGTDGMIYHADPEMSFAQFEDLERDYEESATLSVMMDVTGFEPEIQDGQLSAKCGLTAQYMVCDRTMVNMVEDAYSPLREVSVNTQPLEISNILDSGSRMLQTEVTTTGGRVVDAVVYPEHPMVRRAGELTEMEFTGSVQVLAYNDEGQLEGRVMRWNEQWELPVDREAQVHPSVISVSPPQISSAGRMAVELEVQADTVAQKMGHAITSVEAGELQTPDPDRPSLILRRSGGASLWELAKKCGSTVDAICEANRLSQEPTDDRILLIPIS